MTGFITVSIKDNYLPLSPKPGRKEKLAMRAREARGAERAGGERGGERGRRAGRGTRERAAGGETPRTVLDTDGEWDGHPPERAAPWLRTPWSPNPTQLHFGEIIR